MRLFFLHVFCIGKCSRPAKTLPALFSLAAFALLLLPLLAASAALRGNTPYNNVGLFGYSQGTIKNLGVEKSYIENTCNNSINVGAVVGYNNGGSVTNCYNTGIVSVEPANEINGASVYVGGVVGENAIGGVGVTNCYNTGAVSAEINLNGFSSNTNACAGGVTGFAVNSEMVKNCYSTGAVSATTNDETKAPAYVGGVAGEIYNSAANNVVTNCYFLSNDSTNKEMDVAGSISGSGIGSFANCDSFSGVNGTVDDDGNPATAEKAIFKALNDWVDAQNGTAYHWIILKGI